MNTADLVSALQGYEGPPLTFMEVCGTHTAAISESGIPSLLPEGIRLISGPGCPVCVTVSAYIDRLIELATAPNTCVVTFGDLLRVKGSHGDLRSAIGARVQMVYTPFQAIDLAQRDPETTFVFAAVGFETTAPIYALLAEEIVRREIKNLKLLTALKTMPEDYDVDESRSWWPFKDWQDLVKRVDDIGEDVGGDASQYIEFSPSDNTVFKIKITGESMGMTHEVNAECYVRDSKVRYIQWRED